MTAKQVDRYRLFCKTENAYQYAWTDCLPTACPNNNTHTIDNSTVSIVDSISSAAVEVVQQTGTGGNYTCQSFCFDVPANSTVTQQYSWPYPVSISTMHFTSDTTQVGDYILGQIAPHTVLGTLTADLSTTGTVLSVSPSVAQNAVTGTLATVTDGTNTVNLGNFYNIDAVNNTVSVQNPSQIIVYCRQSYPGHDDIPEHFLGNRSTGAVQLRESAAQRSIDASEHRNADLLHQFRTGT